MQTKIGNKINILIERFIDLYDGKTNLKDKDKDKNKNKDYKTTQPIAHPSHHPSRADLGNQSSGGGHSSSQQIREVHQHAQQPAPQHNFNNAYQGPTTPLIDAVEPMAANEAFGGSMFGGSAF